MQFTKQRCILHEPINLRLMYTEQTDRQITIIDFLLVLCDMKLWPFSLKANTNGPSVVLNFHSNDILDFPFIKPFICFFLSQMTWNNRTDNSQLSKMLPLFINL